ncbi:MAG: hypothetical protein ABII00_06330 [Elusimicrobiota bacterium]
MPREPFDFLRLADRVYKDYPSFDGVPYLLPALYGANEPTRVKCMVVLLSPALAETQRGFLFREPRTVAEALERHRSIFHSWAAKEPMKQFFDLILKACGGEGQRFWFSEEGRNRFFSTLYVTDVWKAESGKDDAYWFGVLREEIVGVRPRLCISFGKDANTAVTEQLKEVANSAHLDRVPIHIPAGFPGGQNRSWPLALDELKSALQRHG